MKIKINYIAMIAVLAFSKTVYGQVVLDNGNFASPDVSLLGLGGIKTYVYNQGSTTYLTGSSGWYVSPGGNPATSTQGSVTVLNQGLLGLIASPVTNEPTSQYLVLNGLVAGLGVITPGTIGGVSQVLNNIVIGQDYLVTYDAAALSLGVATSNKGILSAGIDGNSTVNGPNTGSLVNLTVGTFTPEYFTFTANSTSSTLDFYEPGALLANVGGVAIDSVAITAVPEPRDSLAVLLGLGVAVALLRKRHEKQKAITI